MNSQSTSHRTARTIALDTYRAIADPARDQWVVEMQAIDPNDKAAQRAAGQRWSDAIGPAYDEYEAALDRITREQDAAEV